ncbi:MAG: hypothetical protein ACI4Q6_05460 [Huintestinicola sp.]
MKYDAKNLRINSTVLVILSLLDIFIMIIQIATQGMNIDNIAAEANATKQTAVIAIGIVIGVNALIYLATLFVGIVGIRQADGKCKGGANITVAKILFALNMIGLVFDIISVVSGQPDIQYLCQTLIYVSFLYPYIKCARNV